MSKKGQLTLFIIVAIVVVAVVLLLVILRPALRPEPLDEAKAREIKEFVQAAIEEAVDSSILIIGLSGGYFDQEVTLIETVPVYYLGGKRYIPSIEIIEESLSSIILIVLTNITTPTINETFKDFELVFGKPKIKVEINNGMIANIDWPIVIKRGKTTLTLDKWSVERDVRFLHALNTSTEIVDIISKHPLIIPLAQLHSIEEKSGLEISVDLVADNITVYRLVDEQSKIKNTNFTFYFAIVS